MRKRIDPRDFKWNASIKAWCLKGNYLHTPRTSCKLVDYPTKERRTFIVDGEEYERTIHERAIWRNNTQVTTVIARFIIVNGDFIVID